jgi:acyl dehydratase
MMADRRIRMSDALYFEDLSVGQSWESSGRTITEGDIVQFAGLTGDYDPLHMDHEYAREMPYGRPIAHGLLGLSYLAGLGSTCPRVRTLAFSQIEGWSFQRPLYVGDTVRAVNTVERLQRKGRRSGEVIWHRRLFNQRGETVQQGRFITLVATRLHEREPVAVPASKGNPQASETQTVRIVPR